LLFDAGIHSNMGDGIWLVWQAAADACAAANCISVTHGVCQLPMLPKQYMIADSGLMHRMSTY
jgi:hypothetical protein